MIYNLEYFIAKFEEIPQELWATGKFVDEKNTECKCALGHCGETDDGSQTKETKALYGIIRDNTKDFGYYLAQVNDGDNDTIKYGDNPKLRVINYLKSIRK